MEATLKRASRTLPFHSTVCNVWWHLAEQTWNIIFTGLFLICVSSHENKAWNTSGQLLAIQSIWGDLDEFRNISVSAPIQLAKSENTGCLRSEPLDTLVVC